MTIWSCGKIIYNPLNCDGTRGNCTLAPGSLRITLGGGRGSISWGGIVGPVRVRSGGLAIGLTGDILRGGLLTGDLLGDVLGGLLVGDVL